MERSFCFSLCYFFVYALAFGQFSPPAIDYDQTELIKNEEEHIHKRVYSKKGKTILDVHYRLKGRIQSYCYRSNAGYDSVYIYTGSEIVQIAFAKSGDIIKRSWKQSGRQLHTEMHSKDKIQKYTEYTQLDKSSPAPPCASNYKNYRVGLSETYDKNGTLIESKNYNTGKRYPSKPDSPKQKALKRLKPIADQIVINNYGEDFFNKYIQLNYYLTGGYHEKSRSYHRNNGMPNIDIRDGWFAEWVDTLSLTYADFTYDIVFSEEERYSLIRVRLDNEGKLIETVDQSTANDRAVTIGLLSHPQENISSKKEILKLAKKEGLNLDDENLSVSLVWQEASKHSSKGKLVYEVAFNKWQKKVWGCNLSYFDKWFIDPISKEIDKSGEDVAGDCMAVDARSRRGPNRKYGISDPFKSEPMISYSYDALQSNMSYFLIAKKDGKYGIIDHKENILLPFDYNFISWLKTEKKRFKEEFCKINKDGLVGLGTKNGQVLVEPAYKAIRIEGEDIILLNDNDEKVINMRKQLHGN